MKLRTTTLLLACLVPLASAHADVHQWRDDDGVRQFSDRAPARVETRRSAQSSERSGIAADSLYGEWQAETYDGRVIRLELNPKGSFAFDEEDSASPARVYMCGDWHAEGDSLTLSVSTHQERLRSGSIEKSDERTTRHADILAARGDLLIMRMQSRELTFRRASS